MIWEGAAGYLGTGIGDRKLHLHLHLVVFVWLMWLWQNILAKKWLRRESICFNSIPAHGLSYLGSKGSNSLKQLVTLCPQLEQREQTHECLLLCLLSLLSPGPKPREWHYPQWAAKPSERLCPQWAIIPRERHCLQWALNPGKDTVHSGLGLLISVKAIKTISHEPTDKENPSLRLSSQAILDCVKVTVKTNHHTGEASSCASDFHKPCLLSSSFSFLCLSYARGGVCFHLPSVTPRSPISQETTPWDSSVFFILPWHFFFPLCSVPPVISTFKVSNSNFHSAIKLKNSFSSDIFLNSRASSFDSFYFLSLHA